MPGSTNSIPHRNKQLHCSARRPIQPTSRRMSNKCLPCSSRSRSTCSSRTRYFLRDNFYYCFDIVADSVDPASWHSDPNVRQQFERSIGAIKKWLPILIELKNFIEAGVLVFMPYYITPSFPYGGNAPKTRAAYERLRLTPDTKAAPAATASFDPRLWAAPWDQAPKWSESTKTEVRGLRRTI
jgi:hypothetical protein